MKAVSLMLLRVSIGLLVFLWGLDKLVNVAHGVAVSERFYAGAFSSETVLMAWGVVQSAIGILAVVGWLRRYVLPAVLLINTATMLVVWKSILDPWGWVLEGTNVLFFPSLIIAAGSLLIWAFRAEDTLSLDHRLTGRTAAPEAREPVAAGY